MRSRVEEIRVRNLRSFPNGGGFVPVKEINVLVGKNSSGKSTFARLLPLLRQSFEENTKGPVLWFGKYVDFGDFETSVNNDLKGDDKIIFFDFKVMVSGPFRKRGTVRKSKNILTVMDVIGDNNDNGFEIPVIVTLGVSSSRNNTRASLVSIEVEGNKIEAKNDDQGSDARLVAVNDPTGERLEVNEDLILYGEDFIPGVYERERIGKNRTGYMLMEVSQQVKQSFASYIAVYHHSNKSRKAIEDAIESIPFSSKEDVWEYLRDKFSSDKQFHKNVSSLEREFSEISYMYALCLNLHDLIDELNKTLREFFTGVRYLGPVRATAERFYRYQDLKVNEIDHMGSNLPMVINSLSIPMRKRLEDWMKNNFGFSLSLKSGGSHYALLIQEEGDEKAYNISDMGFGYSQILPVVVSIWLENNSNYRVYQKMRGPSNIIMVIEQPELHLHPELQYKFARAIAKIVSYPSENKVKFFFETHSKHMIDALGHAIREEEINEGVVNISVFDKPRNGLTKISSSGFDEDGYLIDWPVGFLSA